MIFLLFLSSYFLTNVHGQAKLDWNHIGDEEIIDQIENLPPVLRFKDRNCVVEIRRDLECDIVRYNGKCQPGLEEDALCQEHRDTLLGYRLPCPNFVCEFLGK